MQTFPGFDPDRRPPYTQDVYEEIDGKTYVTTYIVSNGYGGSLSVSYSQKKLVEDPRDEEDIERE